MEKFEKVQKASNFELVLFVIFVKFFLGTSKNLKKMSINPCNDWCLLLYYYGAVKNTAVALMQEVATRSVALPRNSCWFSCGASLLS